MFATLRLLPCAAAFHALIDPTKGTAMDAIDLIALLQTVPPHTKIGAFNAESNSDGDVIGGTFTPGEGDDDYYIPPSFVLKTSPA